MLISVEDYINNRECYSYSDESVSFTLKCVEFLDDNYCNQTWNGIYGNTSQTTGSSSVYIQCFSDIVQAVFVSCVMAIENGRFSIDHETNLKEISSAIVHWKMSSQGGRACIRVKGMLSQWNATTSQSLVDGFNKQSIHDFCIGGIRIPTASAFLRFLYPEAWGVIDSRVVKITQRNNITTMSIRNDGYINDTQQNRNKYHNEYSSFLRAEAKMLNALGARYNAIDCEDGNRKQFKFMPADVEMALFNVP